MSPSSLLSSLSLAVAVAWAVGASSSEPVIDVKLASTNAALESTVPDGTMASVNDGPSPSAGPLRRRLEDPVAENLGPRMTNVYNAAADADANLYDADANAVDDADANDNVFVNDNKSARHMTYCAKFAAADREPEPMAPRRASLADPNAAAAADAEYLPKAMMTANGFGNIRSGASVSSSSSSQQEVVGHAGGSAKCIGKTAAGYPCDGVDLQSFVPLSDLNDEVGGKLEANDIWGWSKDKREFALVGLNGGTAVVEITDPTNPVYLGGIRGAGSSTWRDIKVYKDHAFIVSEARSHGMQVVDLNQVLTGSYPRQFSVSARHTGFGNAHNIAINEDSGYAYAVGTNRCSGGLYMIDISSPKNPRFAGCFDDDGYTHDVQCVWYTGDDKPYNNREICFACNEDTVTIVDVTNKQNPRELSKTAYRNSKDGYTHQGWLTEDQRYFIFGDEADETEFGVDTRTYIMDVRDLDNPRIVNYYDHPDNKAIDHNQYIRGQYAYQANYDAGLVVLDVSNVASGRMVQEAYFDVERGNRAEFKGAWSVYPYFPSGTVVLSSTNQGLFVLQPDVLKNSQVGGPGTEVGTEVGGGAVLYKDTFEFAGEGLDRARAITRVATPSNLKDGADGDHVGRLVVPKFPAKRAAGQVLPQSEWIDVAPGSCGAVEVNACVALANPREGKIRFQIVLQFDDNKFSRGGAKALGKQAHERWVCFDGDVSVPNSARRVKRVMVRAKNFTKGARSQEMYVNNVSLRSAC